MNPLFKRLLSKTPIELYDAVRRRLRHTLLSGTDDRVDHSAYIVASAGARWGNILYFLLQGEITGKRVLLGAGNDHAYWLRYFPEFGSQLTVTPNIVLPQPARYFQFFGEDFDYAQLSAFVEKHFLANPQLIRYREEYPYTDALHINVRRGDFYSTPMTALYYGFDVVGFIQYCFQKQAIPREDTIVIISDDIGWCRENLQFLSVYATDVKFPDIQPAEAFFALATARKLIISNSTFTFWAAYISSIYYGENSRVYAPNFVCRVPGYADNKQFLPSWRVLEDFDCNDKAYLLKLIADTYG